MTFKFKILLFSYAFIALICSCLTASEAEIGLDVTADQSDFNLQTSSSRLQGNIILKHLGLKVTGDEAEVIAASESQSQLFIISGEPVRFELKAATSNMSATAGQLTYKPYLELIEIQDKVSITQTTADTQFQINAEELQITLKMGQPLQLIAKGIPIEFTQQLTDRKIVIKADKINWDAESHIAILFQATVIDELTTFSADEIKYYTLTGELSAIGKGDSRPSYRFEPTVEKEATK